MTNLLNGLYVSNGQLFNGAGDPVIIKGVVTEVNRWLTSENTAFVDNQVQMMKAANITFINAIVATGDIESGILSNSTFWANLQRLCAQAAANDMAVIVTGTGTHFNNVWDGYPDCHYLETYFASASPGYTWADWVDWWELYATNLSAYTNVIFDLFREPLCSESVYVYQMRTCIDAIRAIDADRVCNVEATGVDWQYLNFDFELNTGIQRNNIMFSIDAYANYAWSYASYAAEKHMDYMLAAGKCVWISEFNGCTNAAVGSQTFDGSMQQWEEDLINDGLAAGIIGFNMWSWDAYVAFSPVASTDGWNFSYDIVNGYLTTQGTYLAAKYASISDPTPITGVFGYDTIGTIEHFKGTGIIDACRYPVTTTDDITQVLLYCKTNSASGKVKIYLYSDDAGVPDALLATSSEVTVGTSYSWVPFPISASVVAGTYYWFAWMSDVTVYTRYSTSIADQWYWVGSVTYPTAPNPFGSTNNPEGAKVSLYALYGDAPTYDLTITAVDLLTTDPVEGTPHTYDSGEIVTVVITPSSGYYIASLLWERDGQPDYVVPMFPQEDGVFRFFFEMSADTTLTFYPQAFIYDPGSGWLIEYWDSTSKLWVSLDATYEGKVHERNGDESYKFNVANNSTNRTALGFTYGSTVMVPVRFLYKGNHVYAGVCTSAIMTPDSLKCTVKNAAFIALKQAPNTISKTLGLANVSLSYVIAELITTSGLNDTMRPVVNDTTSIDAGPITFKSANAFDAFVRLAENSNLDYWGSGLPGALVVNVGALSGDSYWEKSYDPLTHVDAELYEGAQNVFDKSLIVGKVVIQGTDAITGNDIVGYAGTSGATKSFVYMKPTTTEVLSVVAAKKLLRLNNPCQGVSLPFLTDEVYSWMPGNYLLIDRPDLGLPKYPTGPLEGYLIQRITDDGELSHVEVDVKVDDSEQYLKEISEIAQDVALR